MIAHIKSQEARESIWKKGGGGVTGYASTLDVNLAQWRAHKISVRPGNLTPCFVFYLVGIRSNFAARTILKHSMGSFTILSI